MIEGKGKREKERKYPSPEFQALVPRAEISPSPARGEGVNSLAFQPFSLSATFGFLNVYKPVGMTSHDIVAILRKLTKVKQIGHTGTLDPFAQGVLPIAIGKATRLIEYLDDEKEYLAEISFGKSTNTYDCDGEVTYETGLKIIQEELLEGLKSFEGEILQTPPIYSALKVKGKKLYEYAREGKEVEIEARKIFIERIELQSFDEKSQKAEVLIKCSKGTYIRSIAHDLGQNLGCGAYLSKLIRTQAGKFFIEDAVLLEDIKTIEDIKKGLINPLNLINLLQIIINEDEYKKVLMGQAIELKSNHSTLQPFSLSAKDHSHLVILVYNNNISAMAQIDGNLIKVKKVFV
jgi:tRNA pseudouridine55 synthase